MMPRFHWWNGFALWALFGGNPGLSTGAMAEGESLHSSAGLFDSCGELLH